MENQSETTQETKLDAQTIEFVELSQEKQQEIESQINTEQLNSMTPSLFSAMIKSYYAKNKVIPIHSIDNKARKKKRRAQKAARRLNR